MRCILSHNLLVGLKPELRASVQAQVPKKMKKALLLAKVQKQLLDSKQLKYTKFDGKNTTSLPKFDPKSSASTGSLWKEGQLRDFRRTNGLCIYCGDTYNSCHAAICTKRPQAQVHALAVNDLDQPLSEEVLTQLAVEDAITNNFQQLCSNAIAGTAEGDVLNLRAMVRNKVMLILLDSGSARSFVNFSFLQQVGIKPVPMSPKQFKVANGQVLITDKKVPKLD